MSIPETAYWHSLNQITKGNAWKLWNLSERLGGPDQIFQATGVQLYENGLTQKQAQYLSAACVNYPIIREHDKVLADGTQILIKSGPDYPEWLGQTYDSPAILYVKGHAHLLNQPMIAVVGSRNMTSYGREAIKILLPPLIEAGLGIVSGLAHGVDTAALEMSLTHSDKSVAVVASSLAAHELAPRANLRLAQQIIKCGCIVSETPPGCHPAKARFPLRNRIVSGLSRGVLVIEAAMHSGSLVTARLALEQNREVFAVPGPLYAPYSQGTLWLIQQGAKCVVNVNDVLQELNLTSLQSQLPDKVFIPLNQTQEILWSNFENGPTTVDQLIDKTGLPPSDVLSELITMEITGNLRRLAYGVYDKAT